MESCSCAEHLLQPEGQSVEIVLSKFLFFVPTNKAIKSFYIYLLSPLKSVLKKKRQLIFSSLLIIPDYSVFHAL